MKRIIMVCSLLFVLGAGCSAAIEDTTTEITTNTDMVIETIKDEVKDITTDVSKDIIAKVPKEIIDAVPQKEVVKEVVKDIVKIPAQSNFLVGEWTYGEDAPDSSLGFQKWWTFNSDGTFVLTAYPELNQTGKYKILDQTDTSITIELYEQNGDLGTVNSQMSIELGASNTLTIDGEGPYSAVIQ